MHTWPRRPCRPRERGQSLVEFALIAPLLVAILFGIIELGILLGIYVGLTNSAREGARAGAIYQESSAVTDCPGQMAMDDRRRQFVNAEMRPSLSPMIDATKIISTVTYIPNTCPTSTTFKNYYRSGEIVTVALTYTHDLFFGILKRQNITLTASSSMHIEPGGVR